MADVDLPLQSEVVTSLPTELREDLAKRLSGDLFAFSKFVMGFTDMTMRAHGPMCVFLDHNSKQIKAAAMPRATFKSSIGTVARNLQKLTQSPNRTRLLVNESGGNVEKFLGMIRETAERNEMFRALYSSLIPRDFRKVPAWNSERLFFNREVNKPEASITSIGILGTWTSQHYDDITFDDLISEDAARQDKTMRETFERAKKFRSLFVHPTDSTLTILFTHWAFNDVYQQLFRIINPKLLAKLIRGAVEDDGPIFPERLSLEVLADIRQEIGEYDFSCLYMNNPRNVDIQDFNVNDLRFFTISDDRTHVILFDGDGNEHKRYHISQLDITATVDLAAAESGKSDRNAVTVCGCTPGNEALVLESWASRCTPIKLMEKIFELHRLWSPRVWGIEDVAYQAAYKHFVAFFAEHEDLYLNVKPIKALKRKETRIRGLQPVAATHRLYLQAGQLILRNELADFPLGAHDDAADSLSMQLQVWQTQMSERRWKRQAEVEQQVLSEIHSANLSLSGIHVDPDEVDLDYRPAWYDSYDVGIREKSLWG